MISRGVLAFSGKRVLLLQGPVGSFFARLAADLRGVGARVFKVNFNAGDWLFYQSADFNYRGSMESWPGWFEALVRRLSIDVVFLFGDCRPIHREAHKVASRLGLEIGVFEEGYVRPDYVTLERYGVNGNSLLPRDPDFYRSAEVAVPEKQRVGRTYWAMVWCGFWYFAVGALGKLAFPRYQHHRPLSLMEGGAWVRSAWRKQWYRWKERGIQERLTAHTSRRYFLVPLQVFNDAQIVVHSDFNCIEDFIATVLMSFADHAPDDVSLVFKHHPMDRGYQDYSALIRRLSSENGIEKKVVYIHDQHLPALLDNARGAVVINSTVGLSALRHRAPTKVCGDAIYDLPGLTFQDSLEKFWRIGASEKPDYELFQRFRDYLVVKTQLNGNFYKPLVLPWSFAGLVWCDEDTSRTVDCSIAESASELT